MYNECLICKKHYTQGGSCSHKVRNCLCFEEEPRGKMIRTRIKVFMYEDATTTLVKSRSILELEEDGKIYEVRVAKILEVDMEDFSITLEVDYHENEKPKFEKRKQFKIVK